MKNKAEYHIGKNGPAPCPAKIKCRLDSKHYSTKDEARDAYEKQQEQKKGLHTSISKKRSNDTKSTVPDSRETALINMHKNSITDRHKYDVDSTMRKYDDDGGELEYSENDKDVAMKIAQSTTKRLSYDPVGNKNDAWVNEEGLTSVQKVTLENGDVGYFKAFRKNFVLEKSYQFNLYGLSSLGATTNEVNASRLANSMGNGYEKLVPETVIREVDGEIGSFQREVKSIDSDKISIDGVSLNTDDNDVTSADKTSFDQSFKRAAVFDYVIGSLDRHDDNVIIENNSEDNPEVKLIDNSFSFPDYEYAIAFNGSVINDKVSEHESKLDQKDVESLHNGRNAIKDWMNDGTIDKIRGKQVLMRIDKLLESETIENYQDLHEDF